MAVISVMTVILLSEKYCHCVCIFENIKTVRHFDNYVGK